ncbi:hypothetical protein SBA4_280004 [Candidatus Sulfopaludibacter sp. SbA4]|nr:hypothetical protein SBA4_280004 [Candidatus Sulfopaludibacter sp. SbA4]
MGRFFLVWGYDIELHMKHRLSAN